MGSCNCSIERRRHLCLGLLAFLGLMLIVMVIIAASASHISVNRLLESLQLCFLIRYGYYYN